MFTIKSMGREFPITSKVTDITNVTDQSKLSDLTPGFYKIRMHENFGGYELIVFIISIQEVWGTLGIFITDNVDDGRYSLYWNHGWKLFNPVMDPMEDWVNFVNCDPIVTSKLLINSEESILDTVKRCENEN